MSTDDDKRVALDAQHRESISTDREGAQTSSESIKKKWWRYFLQRGSVAQIITAAVVAVAIGLIISSQVEGSPKLRPAGKRLVPLLGELWLRALKAVVLPLIICSMILAIQRLREMAKGGRALAMWTVGYFVMTTLIAIVISCIMVSLVWGPMFTQASDQDLAVTNSTTQPKEEVPIEEAVAKMFESFVPDNIAKALVQNELLAVLITSILVGCLIKDGDSSLLRAVTEIEAIITIVITELIKLAPIGIFFLILGNIAELDMKAVGKNVGFLIGSTLANMGIHILVVIPIIFFAITRVNPYWYWLKNSPAWITAWGTASSAATLPVTLRCGKARGIPNTICKFALPLGCLINMDGTAIYFPIAVVFLARTQGIDLSAVDYVIICLLSTLSSIGTTPIPSSSLVLTVMIASSVNVPVTGMYSVIVTFDWFLDRFRTALNVSGDLFGAMAVYKITKIEDSDETLDEVEADEMRQADSRV